MREKIKLILVFFFIIFHLYSYSQKINVIDNKGTIRKIKNNKVSFGNNAPSNPIENDIWFDTLNDDIKIFDDSPNSGIWRSIKRYHTGVKGSVFFAGKSGIPSENNSQFFWDNKNNRLRIGANFTNVSNTSKLSVNGLTRAIGFNSSNGTNSSPSYTFSDDLKTGIYKPNTNEIGFTTNGVNRLNISNDTVVVSNNLRVKGMFKDSSDKSGSKGQILFSTNVGTKWKNQFTATIIKKKTDYTLKLSDNGKVFTFDSAIDIILTVPPNLPKGFNISVYQIGNGNVYFKSGGGGVVKLLNRLNRDRTAGKNSAAGLMCIGKNMCYLTGDLKL